MSNLIRMTYLGIELLLSYHCTWLFICSLNKWGLNHNLVLEVFFACKKDEQLAAKYLLHHMNEFDDQAEEPLQ
jgi:hypothetical protein